MNRAEEVSMVGRQVISNKLAGCTVTATYICHPAGHFVNRLTYIAFHKTKSLIPIKLKSLLHPVLVGIMNLPKGWLLGLGNS